MTADREGPAKDEPDDTGRAAKAAAILGAIFAVAAVGLYGVRAAASVTVGAAIAVANLVTMRAIIRALVRAPTEVRPKVAQQPEGPGAEEDAGDKADGASEQPAPTDASTQRDHAEAGRRGGVAWGVFAVLKILILFGGVWILLTRGLVDPIPLVVGYGVLPLGIAASSLWSSLRSPHR